MKKFLIYFIIAFIGAICNSLWGNDAVSYLIGLVTGAFLMMTLDNIR